MFGDRYICSFTFSKNVELFIFIINLFSQPNKVAESLCAYIYWVFIKEMVKMVATITSFLLIKIFIRFTFTITEPVLLPQLYIVVGEAALWKNRRVEATAGGKRTEGCTGDCTWSTTRIRYKKQHKCCCWFVCFESQQINSVLQV